MLFQVVDPLVSGVQEAVHVAPSEKTSLAEPRGEKLVGPVAAVEVGESEGCAAAEELLSLLLLLLSKKPNNGAAKTDGQAHQKNSNENETK